MDTSHHKWVFLLINFKVVTTILGGIIMGIGVHAHYQSSWLTYVSTGKLNISEANGNAILLDDSALRPYQLCQLNNLALYWGWISPNVETCPSVGMENYFVIVVIVSFIISLAGLILLFLKVVRADTHVWQVIEFANHGMFSVLLFVAGLVFIESANEILIFSKHDYPHNKKVLMNLKTQAKISAGAFTIMQSLLYVIVAGLNGYRLNFRYQHLESYNL